MKRAAIYLRVSSAGQVQRAESAEGFSIEAQRLACQRRIAELEAEFAGEYIDSAESAKTAGRPQLQALLRRLREERDLDLVIVHKLDRLARNRADDVAIVAAIRAAGAQLISVSENIDETPTGSLLHGIMASVAEFYSNNLAQEAKKGLHQKARNGGTPGLAPIGYLNVRSVIEGREVRTIELDEERVPHVRWAFAAYASGAYTLDTLHDALAARGLRTRQTAKKPSQPLHRSRIAKMLANPYYLGKVPYGGVIYDGRHDAIVAADTFSRVQAVLAAHNHAGEKDRKHHHYLKGSLYCQCGSRMSLIHANGNGGKYPYSFCIGRMKRTGCQQSYRPTADVETKVARRYGSVHFAESHGMTVGQWPVYIQTIRDKLDEALAGLAKESEAEGPSATPTDRPPRRRTRSPARCLPRRGTTDQNPEEEARPDRSGDRRRPAPPTCRRAVLRRRARAATQGARSGSGLRNGVREVQPSAASSMESGAVRAVHRRRRRSADGRAGRAVQDVARPRLARTAGSRTGPRACFAGPEPREAQYRKSLRPSRLFRLLVLKRGF